MSKIPSINQLLEWTSLTPDAFLIKTRLQKLNWELMQERLRERRYSIDTDLSRRVEWLKKTYAEMYQKGDCFNRFLELRKKYYNF